ncbi:hypothetical protein NHG25_00770 [Aerococcaceae bacterium NML191292]|nr:hypothetical protein [Aerococcaceae bacterium NML191292]
MTVAENRYLLEHRWLPHWFFEQKEALVGAILSEESAFLYKTMVEACTQEDVPYQAADYQAEMIKLTPDLYAVRIRMPQPEYVPHCHRVYLLFNADFTQKAYFTIELGLDGDFICGWNEEGCHFNYGNAPQDLAEELAQITQYFDA